MKKILVISAMECEMNILLQKYNTQLVIIDGYKYYKTSVNNNTLIICKSDLMTINSSLATYIGIKNFNPDIIINQGCAGAYSKDLHTKDIVIASSCINITRYYSPKKDTGSNSLEWKLVDYSEQASLYSEPKILYSDEKLIKLINNVNYEYANKFIGTIGSGDCWNNEIDKINQLNKEYNILCEDMESYGIYDISNKFNIPVISIKIIVDNIVNNETYNKDCLIYLQEYITNVIDYITKEV